jgi:hypothetical protein
MASPGTTPARDGADPSVPHSGQPGVRAVRPRAPPPVGPPPG